LLLVTCTISLSKTYCCPLKIHISLIRLEIWMRSSFIRMEYDIAHLFTYTDFGLIVGLAYVGSICHPGYQSSVVSHIGRDFISFAIIFSHELGHNLGMEHVCGEATKCFMTGDSLDGTKPFSSWQRYPDLVGGGDGNCLCNIPEPHGLLHFKYCGNKVIDEGEQWDCGGWQDCQGH
ncbi:ADA25 protein, partial [Cepphus grylle]|nr:ADA25 protein [Cepphus grylle]